MWTWHTPEGWCLMEEEPSQGGVGGLLVPAPCRAAWLAGPFAARPWPFAARGGDGHGPPLAVAWAAAGAHVATSVTGGGGARDPAFAAAGGAPGGGTTAPPAPLGPRRGADPPDRDPAGPGPAGSDPEDADPWRVFVLENGRWVARTRRDAEQAAGMRDEDAGGPGDAEGWCLCGARDLIETCPHLGTPAALVDAGFLMAGQAARAAPRLEEAWALALGGDGG